VFLAKDARNGAPRCGPPRLPGVMAYGATKAEAEAAVEALALRPTDCLDSESAGEGVEAAWEEEIKRRVDGIRSGRVQTIPGEEVLRRVARKFPGKK
jgi:putative addiction module component (TIGR02574 family)